MRKCRDFHLSVHGRNRSGGAAVGNLDQTTPSREPPQAGGTEFPRTQTRTARYPQYEKDVNLTAIDLIKGIPAYVKRQKIVRAITGARQ